MSDIISSIAEKLAYNRRSSKQLNPVLFNNDRLKPEIKDKILAIVEEFLDYAEVNIRVMDIRLVGSNAAYNYGEYSDLDVHIITDLSEISDPETIARLYFDSIKKNFKDSYDIKIKGIDVELYVEDINSSTMSNGIYSIVNDDWVKQPTPSVEPSEEDMAEAEQLEEEILDSIEEVKTVEELQYIVDKLYLMRKDSLSSSGETGAGNLAFKSLRNKGVLDKIKDILRKSKTKELSLESKKIDEGDCSQRVRKELYHLSPSANKKSILEEGLKSPVYLTWDYKTMLEEDPEFTSRGTKFSLFVVDTTSLNLRKDPEWDLDRDEPWEGYDECLAYICDEDIEPSRIKYIGEVLVTLGPHPYERHVKIPTRDRGLKESVRRSFTHRLNETNLPLRTLRGSIIKRSPKYGVGKEIGGQIYFHKDYVDRICPNLYELASGLLEDKYPDFEYNCLMYDRKKPDVLRFDEAPDFDTAREPMPGNMISVDTSTGEMIKRFSNQIWHHKWLWVMGDYTGFDVQESYSWSKTWLEKISHPSGYKEKWDRELKDVGLS